MRKAQLVLAFVLLWLVMPLAAYASVPAQVTGLTVTVGQRTATLAWTPNGSGDAVTQYLVEQGGNAAGASPVASYEATGLQPNTSYTFAVAAVNATGTGTYSSNVNVTTLPDYATAPTGLAVASATGIAWTANVATEGIEHYNIYLNGSSYDSTTTNSYDFSGLTAGQTYTVAVTAVNGLGESQPATVSLVFGLAAPTDLSLYNGGDYHAYVSWGYPTAGYGFQVTVTGSGTGTGTFAVGPGQDSYQADGLSASTAYTITVKAVGPDGSSLSAASNTLSYTTEAVQGFDQISLVSDAIANVGNLAMFWTILAGMLLIIPIIRLIKLAVRLGENRRWYR